MHEELNQFVRNDVWELTPRPENVHIIGTKWIFKNKIDEDGEIIRNKSQLVAQEYTQVEEVDFAESFTPMARLKSIRILISIVCTPVISSSDQYRCHWASTLSSCLNSQIMDS